MYRKLANPNAPATVTIFIDGMPVKADAGEMVAGVLLRESRPHARTSPVSQSTRAPYCMMGVCFECIATIDGAPSIQTCMTEVKNGMRVERQQGRYASSVLSQEAEFPLAQWTGSNGKVG